ncbi:MAG: WD40 repeat domain-containing protein [Myxococcales bacterium]|nr:WD40 repeat domain-containing protein [Myxococcales bacterium]
MGLFAPSAGAPPAPLEALGPPPGVATLELADPLLAHGPARVDLGPAAQGPGPALPPGALRRLAAPRPRPRDDALAGDGARVAAVEEDGSYALYDARTGARVRELTPAAPYGATGYARFALDGRSVALAVRRDSGHEVRVYDAASGRQRHALDAGAELDDLELAPNGRHLVWNASAYDGPRELVVWTPERGARRTVALPREDRRLDGLGVAPDGASVAFASRAYGRDEADGELELRAVESAATRWKRPLVGAAQRLAFAPDGRRIAVSLSGSRTLVVAADSGASLWEVHDELVGFSADGALFTTRDRRLRERDPATGVRRRSFRGTTSPGAVAATPAGVVVARERYGDHVDAWDRATGQVLLHAGEAGSHVQALAYAADGTRLASTSGDGLELWDARGGITDRRTLPVPTTLGLAALAAERGADATLAAALALESSGGAGAWPVYLDPRTGYAAVLVGDGRVCAFDGAVRRGCAPAATLAVATRSPDGTLLVAGGRYRDVCGVYRASDGELLRALDEGRKLSADGLRFTPDGAHLVTYDGEQTRLDVYRISDGARVAHTVAPEASFTDAAVAPGGALVAAAGRDGRVRFYALPGLEPRGELAGPPSPVTAVAFAPDGRELASAHESGEVLVWDASRAR